MKLKTICFDIDNVICITDDKRNYSKSIPIQKNIEIINKSYDNGFKILKSSGKMIFASHPSKGKKIKLDPFDLIRGKKIFGSWGGGLDYEKNCSKIFKIFRNIKNFDKIFKEKIYNFNEINYAINDFKNGKVLRPIIKIK